MYLMLNQNKNKEKEWIAGFPFYLTLDYMLANNIMQVAPFS
jgi:hypothetical protein